MKKNYLYKKNIHPQIIQIRVCIKNSKIPNKHRNKMYSKNCKIFFNPGIIPDNKYKYNNKIRIKLRRWRKCMMKKDHLNLKKIQKLNLQ